MSAMRFSGYMTRKPKSGHIMVTMLWVLQCRGKNRAVQIWTFVLEKGALVKGMLGASASVLLEFLVHPVECDCAYHQGKVPSLYPPTRAAEQKH
eukprot:1150963-Pelagomonas_calceolata.AAC.6